MSLKFYELNIKDAMENVQEWAWSFTNLITKMQWKTNRNEEKIKFRF